MAIMTYSGEFSIKKGGQDYSFLVLRHLDRMSEGLASGLDVGHINTKKLVAYHNQVLHCENLLVPVLDEEYKRFRDRYVKAIPDVTTTWSNDLNLQIKYFAAVSKILKLQIQKAYNKQIIKLPYRFEDKKNLSDLEELF